MPLLTLALIHSALDKLTVDRLCREGVSIATKALPRPMTLSLAIEIDEAGEIQKRQAFVAIEVASVTLVLQLTAGPLDMRNLQMVVVEAPMQNLLLGEPDLLCTGFNAKQHLGSVREKYHMTDFSTANLALTSALAADSRTPIMGSLSASFALMNADVVDEWDDMPELASSKSDL
jgi:hypothetical protein